MDHLFHGAIRAANFNWHVLGFFQKVIPRFIEPKKLEPLDAEPAEYEEVDDDE